NPQPNNKEEDFERILFLDRLSLQEETKEYIPYVRDILGFKDINFDDVFIIMDPFVKVDRIYEYNIAAARVPSNAMQIDYDLILETKGLLNSTTLSSFSNATLFSWAGTLLGSKQL